MTGRPVARRAILAGAASAALAGGAAAQSGGDIPIIDTHVHLFDPRRPQGVPYSGPRGAPPQIALPDIYHPLAAPTGIVGAIVVEASGWVEDNLWILERARSDPMFVGVVGSLQPDKPDFAEFLGRFSKDPLWRGIRFARVWEKEDGRVRLKPGMAEGLKRLADADQSLDMANPSYDLLEAALRVNDAVPDLRLVMDHMPSLDPMPDTQAFYDRLVMEMAQRPNIFIKLSQVIHKDESGNRDVRLSAHRARLDRLMALFGEDRVMFGSDWPNSVGTATIPETVALVKEYFSDKPIITAEKYFWRNSARIYRWRARLASQPS